METKTLPQITLVSGACCSPGLARVDQVLEKTLQQVLADLGMLVDLRKVSLSVIINGGGNVTVKQREQIMSLFQVYGAKFTPALMIGDEVRFAGKPPTAEQLKEALQGVTAPHT